MIYPFVELIITTKCNLKCNNCSNLIPEYKRGYDVPLDEVLKSIDVILECVDELSFLKIHGGEPLLAQDFAAILDYAASKSKIKCIIVPTNGAYIPSENDFSAMKRNNEKTKLIISNYEVCRKNHERLLQKCCEYGINYELSKEKAWYEFGDVMDYQEDENTLLNRYINCQMRRFPSCYRGKLYSCSRIANGVYLGLIPKELEKEYDLLNCPSDQRKEMFFEFAKKTSCNYCGYCTMNNVRSHKSGEQLI